MNNQNRELSRTAAVTIFTKGLEFKEQFGYYNNT